VHLRCLMASAPVLLLVRLGVTLCAKKPK
jgi:hypothetical protein